MGACGRSRLRTDSCLEKTPDYYERLESSYDPRFYQQEVLGEYVNSRADRVYHCFNPAVHVVGQTYDPTQPADVGVGFQRGANEFGASAAEQGRDW